MNYTEYRKLSKKDVVGRRVRLLQKVRTGLYEIPAGTICRIENKRQGYSLITEGCATCHIKARIDKVPPYCVELIEEKSEDQGE